MLAILFPGGGYFYTRNYLIGLLDAMVQIFLLVYMAVILPDVQSKIEGSIGKMLVVGTIFVAVKIISIIHSTHFINEFIPRKKDVQANPAAAKARPQKQTQNNGDER